jgi:hypothetical protein
MEVVAGDCKVVLPPPAKIGAMLRGELDSAPCTETISGPD